MRSKYYAKSSLSEQLNILLGYPILAEGYTYEVKNLGGAGWVVMRNDGKYLSTYGKNNWTKSEDSAKIFDSSDDAQNALPK